MVAFPGTVLEEEEELFPGEIISTPTRSSPDPFSPAGAAAPPFVGTIIEEGGAVSGEFFPGEVIEEAPVVEERVPEQEPEEVEEERGILRRALDFVRGEGRSEEELAEPAVAQSTQEPDPELPKLRLAEAVGRFSRGESVGGVGWLNEFNPLAAMALRSNLAQSQVNLARGRDWYLNVVRSASGRPAARTIVPQRIITEPNVSGFGSNKAIASLQAGVRKGAFFPEGMSDEQIADFLMRRDVELVREQQETGRRKRTIPAAVFEGVTQMPRYMFTMSKVGLPVFLAEYAVTFEERRAQNVTIDEDGKVAVSPDLEPVWESMLKTGVGVTGQKLVERYTGKVLERFGKTGFAQNMAQKFTGSGLARGVAANRLVQTSMNLLKKLKPTGKLAENIAAVRTATGLQSAPVEVFEELVESWKEGFVNERNSEDPLPERLVNNTAEWVRSLPTLVPTMMIASGLQAGPSVARAQLGRRDRENKVMEAYRLNDVKITRAEADQVLREGVDNPDAGAGLEFIVDFATEKGLLEGPGIEQSAAELEAGVLAPVEDLPEDFAGEVVDEFAGDVIEEGEGLPPLAEEEEAEAALPAREEVGDGFAVERTAEGLTLLTDPGGRQIELDPNIPSHAALIDRLETQRIEAEAEAEAPTELVPVTIPAEAVGAEAELGAEEAAPPPLPAAKPVVEPTAAVDQDEVVAAENAAEVERLGDRLDANTRALLPRLNVGVRFVESVEELPDQVRRGLVQKEATDALGVWSSADDVSYIILGNIADPAKVHVTVLHEAVGHHGMRKVFGDRFTTLLKGVMSSKKLDARLGEVAKANKLDLNTEEGAAEAAEELIARIAEGAEGQSAWKRFVANVRLLLRKLGFEGQMSENDLRGMVKRARARLVTRRGASLLPGADAALGVLAEAQNRVASDEAFGRTVVRDSEGRVVRTINAGSIYPEGWSKQRMQVLQSAVNNVRSGRKLTDLQARTLEDAQRIQVTEAERQDVWAVEAEMELRERRMREDLDTLELAQEDLMMLATPAEEQSVLVRRGGEWLTVENITGFGSVLQDGVVTDVPQNETIDIAGWIAPGEDGYDAALAEFDRQEHLRAEGGALEGDADEELRFMRPRAEEGGIRPPQAELFGFGETGFRLEAERGVDTFRIAEEREAEEAAAEEAERRQGELRFKRPDAERLQRLSIVELARVAAAEKGAKLHRFGERVALQPGLSAAETEAVVTSPGATFEPQQLKMRRDRQDDMTNAELQASMRRPRSGVPIESHDNFAVLDGLELMNRLRAQSRDSALTEADRTAAREQYLETLDEMNKLGMTVGQLMRQFAELKVKIPENVIALAEAAWGKKGRQLPAADRGELTDLAQADFDARDELKAAEVTLLENMNDVNLRAWDAMAQVSKDASDKFTRKVADLTPRSMPDLVRQLLQGNLITLTSQGINIASNVQKMLLEDVGQNADAAAEALLAFIQRRPRDVAFINPVARLKGFGTGLKRGGRELITGVAPHTGVHGEVDVRGFHPLHAFTKLFKLLTGKGEPGMLVDERGSVPIEDRMKLIVEALAGPAELQFRLLGLGDHPFREARYRAVLEERANLKKLKGIEREVFMRVPDAGSRELALKESLEAVFQERGVALRGLQQAIRTIRESGQIGDWADALIITPIAPFKATPVNVMNQALMYAYPPVAWAKSAYHVMAARKSAKAADAAATAEKRAKLEGERVRHHRQAISHARIAVIAHGMVWAAALLARLGIVQGAPPKDDKGRSLAYQNGRPYAMNMSALKRLLSGQDAAPQEGDTWRNLFFFGFFGINSLIASNRLQKVEAEAAKTGKQRADIEREAKNLVHMVPELGSTMMDMTLLKGANDLLESVSKGEYDQFVENYARTITAVPLPGVLGSFNRSRQVYLPDLESDDKWAAFTKAVDEKNPFIDWETAYPFRRDPLGQPIERTPEGAVPWVFHMIDASKGGKVPDDPVWEEIGRVYGASDQNSKAIPSTPDRTFTRNKVKLDLNPREYERFMEIVGAERIRFFERMTGTGGYRNASPGSQAKILERAWNRGLERGKSLFFRELNEKGTDFQARFAEAAELLRSRR